MPHLTLDYSGNLRETGRFDVLCAALARELVAFEADGKEKNNQAGRVYGPQVEIESSGAKGAEAGYVYGEATGLGWLTPPDKLKPHKTFKDGEWNHYRVVAKGPLIQTWINGQPIEDITHEEIYKSFPAGFIGLQVHGVKKGLGPFEVRWRNIRIEELK